MIGNSKYYNNNENLKKAGVAQKMTPEEQKEYIRCMEDIVYFCEKYVRVLSVDHGYVPFKPYEFQKKVLRAIQKNRQVICKLFRQAGKTTVVAAYLLHFALFNKEKTIAILANKGDQAQEILFRIQTMYEALPWFLQPGVKVWNKRRIELGNDSIIFASASNGSGVRGKSISVLYVDEAAFLERADEFFQSTYPTITSGKETKVIMTSTPNGMNFFYRMWTEAENGISEFVPVSAKWQDHPDRDQAWFDSMCRNMPPKQIAQEILCEFLGSADTLLSGPTLGSLVAHDYEMDGDYLRVYERPDPRHIYVGCVDTSEGVGLDYSVISVIDVTEKPYKLVAQWRDNETIPADFAYIVRDVLEYYNDALAIIESNNSSGGIVSTYLQDLEYNNILTTGVKKSENVYSEDKNHEIGVRTTRRTKAIGCTYLKQLIESNTLLIHDDETIKELSTFILRSGTYKADRNKHDDCVMPLVLFAWFTTQEYFEDYVEDKPMFTDSGERVELSPSLSIVNEWQDEIEIELLLDPEAASLLNM